MGVRETPDPGGHPSGWSANANPHQRNQARQVAVHSIYRQLAILPPAVCKPQDVLLFRCKAVLKAQAAIVIRLQVVGAHAPLYIVQGYTRPWIGESTAEPYRETVHEAPAAGS